MSISSSVIGSNGKGAEPLWDNAEFFWAHVVTSFAEKEIKTQCFYYSATIGDKAFFFLMLLENNKLSQGDGNTASVGCIVRLYI